ncbi:MAG: hypothetical protein LBV30_08425 [Propionibacteriaceae bacterium]|jgi:hypothetical protein|nr:hypothetical protein [Propionibacteriaceae bacterium]
MAQRRGNRRGSGWGKSALVVAVALIGLSACTAGNPDLPTLGGSQAGAAGGNQLVLVAKEFYDCMNDAGVPVYLQENSKGELTTVGYGSSMQDALPYVVRGEDFGMTSVPTEASAAEQQAMEDFQNGEGIGLLVDGVDHSQIYGQCLDQTGYDQQAAWNADDPGMDPEQTQQQVDVNNEWAACARENGFPALKDSTMPTDLKDYQQSPTILLPGTISPEQLSQLLEACPNWDPAIQEAQWDWFDEHPNEDMPTELLRPTPNINFDFPDLPAGDPSSFTEQETGEMDRQAALYELLFGPMNDWYEANQDRMGG